MRANGLSIHGDSQLLSTAQALAARPEPMTYTCRQGHYSPLRAGIKIPSLLAMQIVPGDNEVAREEVVLGELPRARPSSVAEFLICRFRKFLSKLPGIISSWETLTLLFVFCLMPLAQRW